MYERARVSMCVCLFVGLFVCVCGRAGARSSMYALLISGWAGGCECMCLRLRRFSRESAYPSVRACVCAYMRVCVCEGDGGGGGGSWWMIGWAGG